MATDAGIVTDRDRSRRVDEGHLHDLAVAPDREPGVWELSPPMNTCSLMRVPEPISTCGVSIMLVAPIWTKAPRRTGLAANEAEEPHAHMIAELDIVTRDNGSEAKADAAADAVSLQAVPQLLRGEGHHP